MNGITAYIIRRLCLSVLSVLLVVTLVFIAVRLMPGDIVDQFYADRGSDPVEAEQLRQQLGLKDPIVEQYGRYLKNVLTGNFGHSLQTGESIPEQFKARAPRTIEVGILSLLIGTILGIPLGVISATRQSSALDYSLRSAAILGISIPYFLIGVLTISLPAYYWHWTPPTGHVAFFGHPISNLQHYLLPSAILAVGLAGTTMRLMRATMLEVMNQDFMRTAKSKGLNERTRIMRHALRNALIPVVTLIGLRFAFLLSGTAIVESIYSIPGMGTYLLDGLAHRDYPIVQAVTVFVAIVIITVNLCVDLSYGMIDPRIRRA